MKDLIIYFITCCGAYVLSLYIFEMTKRRFLKQPTTQYVAKPIANTSYQMPLTGVQIEAIETIGKLACNNKYVILSDFVVKDNKDSRCKCIKLVVYEGKDAERVKEML